MATGPPCSTIPAIATTSPRCARRSTRPAAISLEWFFPYPWRELKLSEFPNLAELRSGFPHEHHLLRRGRLPRPHTPEIHAPFEITAHEAAHQWWGNILSAGKAPGGVVLTEGTADFSAILLVEQVKGINARIDFCKRLEATYGKSRQADTERPLVKLDQEDRRPGDTTAIYDKGGWVFWMLLNHLGRDQALAGIQSFFKTYHGNPDHPVIQDFVAAMRPFARDPSAFDAFVRQWFFEVVVPEFQLSEPRKTLNGSNWEVTARIQNIGTGRCPSRSPPRGESGSPRMARPRPSTVRRALRSPRQGRITRLSIPCPFEPDRIVVDPDAKVLQLQRKNAVAKF